MSTKSGNLTNKISRAKAKLLVEYPYFGTLASRLEFEVNDDIPNFLTDGSRFEYNDDYLDGLELDELGFALSNGAMHAALGHDNRQKGRMGWLWQLATDHAINTMLVENGLEAPFGINYDERFEGMYAEEIYATLKDEIQNEEYDDDESNETGFNEENKRRQEQMKNAEGDHDPDKKRPQMEVENVAQEMQWEQIAKEAMEKFDKQGELPGGIERFFELLVIAKVDWRSELDHAINVHAKTDYRLMPPSKKLLYMGTYLPASYSEQLELVIAIDSSGSVDELLLGRFMAEIESLLLLYPSYQIDLLICDAKIHSHQQFVNGEPLQYELKGGGGTDFRPVFEWLEQHGPLNPLLLYFTDLQGKFPEVEPPFETLWIAPEHLDTPFGKTIVLE